MVLSSRWTWDALILALFLGAALLTGACWIHPPLGLTPGMWDEPLILKPGETIPVPDPKLFTSLDRLLVTTVKVKPGDHLWSLAKSYGTTWDSIRSTNKLDSVTLSPGQKITIHNHKGMIYRVGTGHSKSLQDVARLFRQDPTVLAMINGLPGVSLLSGEFKSGEAVFIPNSLLKFPDYILPVGWGPFSSKFGVRFHPLLKYRRLHAGVDMPRPYGTPVRASREGRVIEAGWNGHYGQLVIIKHLDGVTTWYGHLSKIRVSSGAWIKQRQVIGQVGSTGLSTGPHLHFEVRGRSGRPLNPRKYLQ